MSLYSSLKRPLPNGFGYGSTAEEVTAGVSLAGKTILVTGCNSGLGLETLRVLALRGAQVFGTARTEEKARAACDAAGGGRAKGFACELADPASVRACVAAVTRTGARLDAVICNAGIMALPKLETAHGYELQFFTNHIGHFILVTGLLEQLADDARVVVVSSDAHRRAPPGGIEFDNLKGEKGYSPWAAYGQSKVANILFARELARRFEGTKKTANALHPGVIATNLTRHMNVVLQGLWSVMSAVALKTVPQGAATECYVAVNPGAAGISGAYFSDCNVSKTRSDINDAALPGRLWAESERIVAAVSA